MENPLNNLQQNPQDNPPSSLRTSVLEQIKSGSVSVTPKWRFTASTIISVAGLIFGFLVVIFTASFLHYSLREAGILDLPTFGGEGLKAFFWALPWIPIIVLIICSLVLEVWLLRYGFAYRRPLLYSTLGIIGCLTVGTVLAAVTQVHEGMFEVAEQDNVPLAKPMYHSFIDIDVPKLHKGMVSKTQSQGFVLRGRGGQVMNVTVTRETRVMPPMEVRVGDMVVVFGEDENGFIRAIGIKHLPDDRKFAPPFSPLGE